MNRRAILAGVLAGLTVFFWSFLSHMALPLGEIGVRQLPNQSAVMAALSENVKTAGFYYYPFDKDMAQHDALLKTNPHGVLVYTPPGEVSFGKLLATEALSNVAGGILA